MNTIPRLDLTAFVSGNDELKKDFVSQIGAAFEEFGFVCIKNIYIDKKDIDAYYNSISNFFALPIATKEKYEIPGLAGQRGYTSFGKEHAKGSDAPDLKEFWQMGQTVEGQDAIKEEYPDNIIVSEIDDFNDLGLKLYKGFEKTGSYILGNEKNWCSPPKLLFTLFLSQRLVRDHSWFARASNLVRLSIKCFCGL
jgi:isopenicillin N synthase-like dioxygenase